MEARLEAKIQNTFTGNVYQESLAILLQDPNSDNMSLGIPFIETMIDSLAIIFMALLLMAFVVGLIEKMLTQEGMEKGELIKQFIFFILMVYIIVNMPYFLSKVWNAGYTVMNRFESFNYNGSSNDFANQIFESIKRNNVKTYPNGISYLPNTQISLLLVLFTFIGYIYWVVGLLMKGFCYYLLIRVYVSFFLIPFSLPNSLELGYKNIRSFYPFIEFFKNFLQASLAIIILNIADVLTMSVITDPSVASSTILFASTLIGSLAAITMSLFKTNTWVNDIFGM